MDNHKKGGLSAYWQKLVSEAETILEKRIGDLSSQTVDPDLCLIPSDRKLMESRRFDLEFMQHVLEKVRGGSKFWAFDTVWSENPCHVFKPG